MKVKIELELSPSEARKMLDLPDFSQLHSIITKDLAEHVRKIHKKLLKHLSNLHYKTDLQNFQPIKK